MTTKQITIYVTEDGKEFRVNAEAIAHENCLQVIKALELDYDTPPLRLDQQMAIARAILEKFNLTPR